MTYLIVDLAPVFLLGIILNIFCFVVPISWYWVFYTVQIVNIAGAAGDYYIAYHLFALPKKVLVRDVGTHVIAYVASENTETPSEQAVSE